MDTVSVDKIEAFIQHGFIIEEIFPFPGLLDNSLCALQTTGLPVFSEILSTSFRLTEQVFHKIGSLGVKTEMLDQDSNGS